MEYRSEISKDEAKLKLEKEIGIEFEYSDALYDENKAAWVFTIKIENVETLLHVSTAEDFIPYLALAEHLNLTFSETLSRHVFLNYGTEYIFGIGKLKNQYCYTEKGWLDLQEIENIFLEKFGNKRKNYSMKDENWAVYIYRNGCFSTSYKKNEKLDWPVSEKIELLFTDLEDKVLSLNTEKIENRIKQNQAEILEADKKTEEREIVPEEDPILDIKNYQDEILANSISLIPMIDERARLGYNMKPLMLEVQDMCYAFIPPITQKSIEWTTNDSLEIISLSIENTVIVENKITSITINCKINIDNLDITVSKIYKGGQIRYIKRFPVLSLFGPAPKFGWIARRNLTYEFYKHYEYPSPLINESVAAIDGLNDIEFAGMQFDKIESDYFIYCGEIPKWLGVRGNGSWLGALPLRVVSETEQLDWKKAPNFIHGELPSQKRMNVAVDIGFSSFVVLFLEEGMREEEIKKVLIEEGQVLSVPITTPLYYKPDRETQFSNTKFQSEKQYEVVQGKIPVGIIGTPLLYSNTGNDLLLYKSGKLILLNPKTVSEASGVKITSDIKSNVEEKRNEMELLIQGILTMIIDRSLHLECSEINIRTAYLKENYEFMKSCWESAKENIEKRMPYLRPKINIDLYLPESLAIANRICHNNAFHTGSGAALIDIKALSTDIALFKNKAAKDSSADASSVSLVTNFSIRLGGHKIILQPIWDYLYFSKYKKVEDLFKVDTRDNSNLIDIVKKLNDELTKQRSEKHIDVNKARNNLLCLINRLQKGQIPLELQNLFDLGYLAEIVILKNFVKTMTKGDGTFDIHLFGGGSSHFTGQKDGFNCGAIIGRICETYDRSADGDILALGLLSGADGKMHKNIEAAAAEAKKEAQNYIKTIKKQPIITTASVKELEENYAQFIEAAEILKPSWYFKDNYSNNLDARWVLNVKEKQERTASYEPLDSSLWTQNFEPAMDFARNCRTDSMEIFKILFSYKMAYLNAVAFYNGER
ncbi:hypothetical protein [Treponema denticola]|uniref:hypothetical protein n=1 Tax=Treponema denticola TaxID=158 RepID=UPI00210408C1|nr:hypothetical protein [Treponema denticola]UTY22793.1 hypothetical protein E4N78_00365 [Treponema denticola]